MVSKWTKAYLLNFFFSVGITLFLSCNEKGEQKNILESKGIQSIEDKYTELSKWMTKELCDGKEWHNPENLKETHQLLLYKCNLKNEDIKKLSEYTFLTEKIDTISIGGKALTDNSLEYLKEFTKLEFLAFPRSQITLKGLSNHEVFHQLKGLQLDLIPYTNKDLKDISIFKKLEFMTIIGTQINDDGLAYLTPLKNLKKLFIINPAITDKSTQYLKQMKSLELLNLERTSVTSKGLKILKKELPDTEIISADN